jgi:hypothetical protein
MIKLHSTAGGSDKVYELYIMQRPDGLYDLNYANGRRVSGAVAGKKPKNVYPMPLAVINSMAEEILQGKRSKGYHLWGDCDLCGRMVMENPGNVFADAYGRATVRQNLNTPDRPIPPTPNAIRNKKRLIIPEPPVVAPPSPPTAPKRVTRTIALDDDDL